MNIFLQQFHHLVHTRLPPLTQWLNQKVQLITVPSILKHDERCSQVRRKTFSYDQLLII